MAGLIYLSASGFRNGQVKPCTRHSSSRCSSLLLTSGCDDRRFRPTKDGKRSANPQPGIRIFGKEQEL